LKHTSDITQWISANKAIVLPVIPPSAQQANAVAKPGKIAHDIPVVKLLGVVSTSSTIDSMFSNLPFNPLHGNEA